MREHLYRIISAFACIVVLASLAVAQLPPQATGLPFGTSLSGQSAGKMAYSANSVWWVRPGSPAQRTYSTPVGYTITDVVSASPECFVLQSNGEIYGFTWGANDAAHLISKVPLVDTLLEAVRRMTSTMEVISSRRVYATPDGGASWTLDTVGLGGGNIGASDITVDASGTLYLTATSGLYRRPVDSTRWTKIPITGATGSPTVVRLDGVGTMLVVQSSVWTSMDAGTTWKRDTVGLGGSTVSRATIATVAGQPQFFLVASSSQRIYTRAPGGSTWTRIDGAINTTIVDPNSPPTYSGVAGDSVLFASSSVGLFESVDGGTSWTNVAAGFEPENVGGIVRSGGSDFVATDLGVFRGRLGGTLWTRVWPVSGYYRVTGLRVDGTGHVYLLGPRSRQSGTSPRAVSVSSDGGSTWIVDTAGVSAISNASVYYVDPHGMQHLSTTGGGQGSRASLWSKDPAGSWTRDTSGLGTIGQSETVTAFGSDGGTKIFAAGSIGGARMWSRPWIGGAWAVDTTGIDTSMVYSITGTNPTSAGGTLNRVFLRQGTNWGWVKGPAGIDSTDVYLVSRDSTGALFGAFRMPHNNGFFTTYTYSGIYFTSDAGQRWLPAGAASLNAGALTSFGDTTYLTLSGRGVYQLTSRSIARLSTSASVLSFGNANVGESKSLELRISNTGTDTLLISSIVSDNPAFTSTKSKVAVPPASSVLDTVRFSPSVAGFNGGVLTLTSNAVTNPDHVTLGGNGIASSFMISARTVDFGAVHVGATGIVKEIFTNSGTDTLHITGATSTNSKFASLASRIDILPGGSYHDSLAFTPNGNGIESGLIIIRSSAASSPDTIRVTGQGQAPVASFSARAVAFNNVPVGTAGVRLLSLTNRGTDTLHVSSVTVGPAEFTSMWTAAAFSIAPGAARADSVHFVPALAQAYSGYIVFVSDAPSSPDTIALSGTGTTTGVREAIPAGWVISAVAPNPARDRALFSVTMPGENSCVVSITDMLGREMIGAQHVALDGGSASITIPDVTSLAAGTYVVSIVATHGSALRMFIRE
jgi:hypothetical protein